MKKLMTMIAAAATAFGLYAANVATDFADLATGKFDVLQNDGGQYSGGGSTDRYWSYSAAEWTDEELSIQEGTEKKFLSFKTGAQALYRNFSGQASSQAGDPTELGAEKEIDGALYAEMQIKFGAPADDLSIVDGAKFVASVIDETEATEVAFDSKGTNLWVIGGYYDANGALKNRAFRMQVNGNGGEITIDEAWLTANKRVVIKAYEDVGEGLPGFILYVGSNFATVKGWAPVLESGSIDFANYAEVSTANYLGDSTKITQTFRYGRKQLLLPLVTGDTLTAVGFKGRGALDSIALGDTAPADIDFNDAVQITVNVGEGVESATAEVGGVVKTLESGANLVEFGQGESITVAATFASGKVPVWKKGEVDVTKDVTDGSYTDTFNANETLTISAVAPAATVNGKAYATFADALEAAAELDTVVLALNSAAAIADEGNMVIGEAKVWTIDLNGQTLAFNLGDGLSSCIENDGTLTITNSGDVATGKIVNVADEPAALISNNGTVAIQAGIFDGALFAEDAEGNYEISGGSFLKDLNTGDDNNFKYNVAEGKGPIDAGDYWQVQEAPEMTWVTFNVPAHAMISYVEPLEGETGDFDDNMWELSTPGTYKVILEVDDYDYFYEEDVVAEVVTLTRGQAEYTLQTPAPQKKVAENSNTGKYYASLKAAVDAAQDGDTISLLDDAEGDCLAITAGQFPGDGLAIDLNNHTYTFNRSAKDGITIQTNDVVTIMNGTFAVNAGAGAFRDFVRVYGNLDTEVTFQTVTFETTNMEATWTEGQTVRPTDAVRIEGGNVKLEMSVIGGGCGYAVKFGNHAQAFYELGTLTFEGGEINGKVILMGGEFVELNAPEGDVEYHFGKNVHSTYEDHMATDYSGNELFAARVGVALPETGEENNDAGILYKDVEDAKEALEEGKTLTFITDYELFDDETFDCALAVADEVQITLGEFKLTDKAGLLDVETAFTDEDVEVKPNEDGTYTYSVAAAPEDWPTEWADIPADDAVKAKFPAWRAGDGADADLSTDLAKNAFLLNCTTDEVSDIKIEEINVLADGFVGIKFSVPGMFGFKRPISEMNGALFVEAGDALDKMTAQNVATWSATDNTGNFTIKANFVRVKIGFKAPETDAVQPAE